MGSSFTGEVYTRDEAANRLGRTKKSVDNYAKKGLIRKGSSGGNIVFPKEDVDQLAVEIGAGLPAMNRKTFYELVGKVRRLEEFEAVVRMMLDLDSSALRPNSKECPALYKAACDSLASGKWSVDEAKLWASQFSAFDEQTIELLSKQVNDPQPWLPFYRLCLNMATAVEALHSKAPSYELEGVLLKLREGRRRLRSGIILWIEMGRGTLPEGVLQTLDGEKEALLKRLKGVKKG